MRLRLTALPKRRVTTSPRRGPGASVGARVTPKWREYSRFPWAWARRYSARRRSRSALVKLAVPLTVGVGTGHRSTECEVGLRDTPPILNRQAFAAPGPAALDDGAAAFGAHPLQEAVGPGPAQIMRLISAFCHLRILVLPELFPNIL